MWCTRRTSLSTNKKSMLTLASKAIIITRLKPDLSTNILSVSNFSSKFLNCFVLKLPWPSPPVITFFSISEFSYMLIRFCYRAMK